MNENGVGRAAQVSQDPARYHIPDADAHAIAQAVEAFAEAHKANRQRHTRSSATAARKNEARAVAEQLIRKAAHLIRVNQQISAGDKVAVGVREKPARLGKRQCPQTPPKLSLVGGQHGWQLRSNRHRIRFVDPARPQSKAKPEGAARLELWVDVIPMGEQPPDRPSSRFGAHPLYLRSYSRSPIDVDYPKFAGPVQVLYWGRWASATGDDRAVLAHAGGAGGRVLDATRPAGPRGRDPRGPRVARAAAADGRRHHAPPRACPIT